ncbi:hypothetical protein [Adlercreutzia sp. ZJ242]|uniref:hypothetical protein n=1 Tax=Adlercreutzia sp. ZJ242 TaxID=2709409 RepID=UPI00197EA2E3|nr:hypothetical protein [Adlercreutzia sp. ZJ242]
MRNRPPRPWIGADDKGCFLGLMQDGSAPGAACGSAAKGCKAAALQDLDVDLGTYNEFVIGTPT